ncbi:MAG: putative CopG family antitoxin [Candidatus Woesearchaeota archaeon]|jgi:predicted CopG family antitoxin
MISMAITTIQISKELLADLKARKMYDKESYEDIIRDLLEDTSELSEQTKADIQKSQADVQAGRIKTLAQVEARLHK